MTRPVPALALASLSFFEGFTEAQVGEVAAAARLRTLDPREPVAPEGKPLRWLVLVVRGNLEVQAADGVRRLSVLRPGDTFGLAELFEAGAAGTLVRSVGDAVVLELEPDAFRGLCARGDDLSLRLSSRVVSGLAAGLRLASDELDRRERMAAVTSPLSRGNAPRPASPPSSPAPRPATPSPPPKASAPLPDPLMPLPEPPPDLPEEELQAWMDDLTAGRKDLDAVRNVESGEVKTRRGRGRLF